MSYLAEEECHELWIRVQQMESELQELRGIEASHIRLEEELLELEDEISQANAEAAKAEAERDELRAAGAALVDWVAGGGPDDIPDLVRAFATDVVPLPDDQELVLAAFEKPKIDAGWEGPDETGCWAASWDDVVAALDRVCGVFRGH